MFEVEQKFILTKEQEARLLEGAELVSEKTFTDQYFDTEDCALTKNDIWLRKRGESFELKIPMHKNSESLTQQYQEIDGEEKIREIFDLVPQVDFEKDIAAFGYASFCVCITTRRKFKKNGFVIDLDEIAYNSPGGGLDDFDYKIAEIELLVESKDEMNEAAKKIENFAKQNGLEISLVRGKVLEYLKRKKPQHYEALVEAGIVKR